MTPNEIDAAARLILPLLKREVSMMTNIYAPTDPLGAPLAAKAQQAMIEFERLILFAKGAANGNHPDHGKQA